MFRLPSLVKLAYPSRWLNLALMLSIVCLALQLSGPAVLRWWRSPGPGSLGTGFFEGAPPTICLANAYLAYLPENYRQAESWPLIVYLHGGGGRGNDPRILAVVARMLAAQTEFYCPGVVLVPQCHQQGSWEAEDVIRLIEFATRKYNINQQNIYLIGFSMGGLGTWETAAAEPDKFAAIVPIAGRGHIKRAERLVEVPTWAFHGARDTAVTSAHSEDMVKAMQMLGGKPKLNVFADEGHGIRDKVLNTDKLWLWLCEQSRK